MDRINIVCFSVNNWEKRWARKQHFMLQLSMRPEVKNVVYVEPPLALHRIFLSNPAKDWMRWKRALFLTEYRYRENLSVVTPLFILPFSGMGIIHRINRFISLNLMKIAELIPPVSSSVIWLYHPYDHYLAGWLKGNLLSCFDWAEEWSEYFIELSAAQRRRIAGLEEKIIKNVDVVFTVSEEMAAAARKLNPESYFLPSGTMPEIFSPDKKPVLSAEMQKLKHPVLGYIGTINERVDIALLIKISENIPDCSIALIGDLHCQRTDISALAGRKNIYLLPGQYFWDLPAYTWAFDVCLLPYVPALTKVEPTKIYDYLATGKPVVATACPEIKKFGDYIFIAGNADEFVECIKKGLTEDDDSKRKKRLVLAQENSWSKRAEEIMKFIQKNIKGKQ